MGVLAKHQVEGRSTVACLLAATRLSLPRLDLHAASQPSAEVVMRFLQRGVEAIGP